MVYPAPVQGTSPPEVRSHAADNPANCSESRTTSKDPTVLSVRRLSASGRTAIRRRIATVMLGHGHAPHPAAGPVGGLPRRADHRRLGGRLPGGAGAGAAFSTAADRGPDGAAGRVGHTFEHADHGVQRVLSVLAGVALAMLFVAVVGLSWARTSPPCSLISREVSVAR